MAGRPVEETADLLRLRLWDALRGDGETEDRPPGHDWYVNLVHFAAPLPSPVDGAAADAVNSR